jgi:hypothetical protein
MLGVFKNFFNGKKHSFSRFFKAQQPLRLGFDYFENGQPLCPNGRSPRSVRFQESEPYDLSDPSKEIPYGYSWTLNQMLFDSLHIEKGDVQDLVQKNELWFYPISPIGAFKHWLITQPDDENELLYHCPESTLENIRTGSAFLLIDYAFEGNGFQLSIEPIFENLHRIFKKRQIPADKVFFLFGNQLSETLYQDWCTSHYIQNQINMIAVNLFETVVFHDFKGFRHRFIEPVQALNIPIENRKHKFLYFNRIPHEHRQVASTLMFQRKLLEHGLFSFPERKHVQHSNLIFSEIWVNENLTQKHLFLETLPRYIDIKDFNANPVNAETSANFYLQTRFSIVSETTFHGDNVFLSEKIFKPISQCHPFVAIAHPGTLKTLKTFGYKTFHPFIREDYDSIQDPYLRIEAVVSEIERLIHLNETEWGKIWPKLMSIALHNRMTFQWRQGSSLASAKKKILLAT